MSALNGKVAIITGGSSGIRLATAKRFVGEGAYVFITGRRQSELDKAVAEIGKNVTAIPGDIVSLEDLDRIYKVIAGTRKKLDIVVANAGFAAIVATQDVTPEHFDKRDRCGCTLPCFQREQLHCRHQPACRWRLASRLKAALTRTSSSSALHKAHPSICRHSKLAASVAKAVQG